MTRWHHRCGSHGSGAARRADPRAKSSRARSGGSRTSDILRFDVAGPTGRAAGLQHPLHPALPAVATGKWILGEAAKPPTQAQQCM